MEKWKRVVKNLLVCVGIVLITIVIDCFIQDYIYKNRCEIVKNDFSHVFQIDSLEQVNNKLVLTGWVFELETDSVEVDYEIILYDYNNNKEYYMDVEDVLREDVNEYFMCEYDYLKSGFVASCSLRRLDLDDKNYEVLIRPREVRKAYKTSTYISKGEIMFAEPESFVALDIGGTELETIVNDGVLRVYRPDVGIYVYQFEGSLYYITDNNYLFEEDNSTYLECQIDTTQIDKLPKHRLDNNHFWDNIGFVFEKYELENMNLGKYRCAKITLPSKYSVEKIWTGYFIDGWIWRNYFRPWYEFK